MIAPKPVARNQNWQVQNLDGSPVGGYDFPTKEKADAAALQLRTDFQRPVRVRRTS